MSNLYNQIVIFGDSLTQVFFLKFKIKMINWYLANLLSYLYIMYLFL